jgi:putative ABC transport system ATP-binding protein
MSTATAAVSVRGLTKTYGAGPLAVSAVHDVSFDVNAGEVVLIMGPSGSGKTTLLLMLGALLRPTSGRIVIDGADLSTVREAALPPLRAKHFGFVFQDFNLLSALSVVENVELACNLAGVTGRAARDRATRLLTRLGMTDRLTFHPEQLSGGEKQRVVLARALANDPAVILADEPTANLDSGNGRHRPTAARTGHPGPTKRHHRFPRPAAQRHRRPHPLARRRPLPRTRRHGIRSGLRHARRDGRSPRRDYAGRTWWFCSVHCRDEFAHAPQQFAAPSESVAGPSLP